MSLTIITQPDRYMAGYSAVPLKVYDTDYDNYTGFKYIVNIAWDKRVVSNDTPYAFNNSVYTKLTFTTTHEFNVGDSVILDDTINNNLNTGYYNVKKIISTTEVLIDLITSTPFVNNGATLSKVIKYNISPDLDGYGKVDLSNVLKDFVSYNIDGESVDYGLSYEGVSTRFSYEIFCGEEYYYSVSFDDNIFLGGNVGFFNSGITSMNGVSFQVGDQILIQQDIVEWEYYDNYFGGNVGFVGLTQHSFLVGQQISVTGQQTYPYYNGTSTIINVVGSNVLVIDKAWQGSTPVEPGKIYGVPRPEYNGVATITAIYIDPTYGLVIKTDLPYSTSSIPIGGTITYSNGQIFTQPILLKTELKNVYNSYLNQDEYSVDGYDPYVIQSRPIIENNISTILNDDNKCRVEFSTIGFLLAHTPPSGTTFNTGMAYEFFDDNGTLLGVVRIPKSQLAQTDWYSPIGVEQIGLSPYVDFIGTFSTYSSLVSTYNAYVYLSTGTITQLSNKVSFEINGDCSKYEIYHLLWVDKLGSIISMPFIYVSRTNIEVQRKNYYQQEGNWENDTFGYKDYDRGERSFYTQSRKSLILNSGFLKDYETDLVEDMMQSIAVFVQTPDNKIYSCQLAIDAVELYKNINEQIFQYTMNVRYSVNQNRF